MAKAKDYVLLHLNILLFSLTSVFSKLASTQYVKYGLSSALLYVFWFLMLLNCAVYALEWQQVIKKFELSTERVSDLVAGLGGGDFSRKFVRAEYHRHDGDSGGSTGGAEI